MNQSPWYYGTSILQWLIFSKPNHIFLRNTLLNIIELITHEYYNHTWIEPECLQTKSNVVVWCTGPGVFTASILDTINRTKNEISFRYADKDFNMYGGQYKSKSYQADKTRYYYNLMQGGKRIPFLRKYAKQHEEEYE